MNLHPALSQLVELFPDPELLIQQARQSPPLETPEPYRQLLAHQSHMTVVMESYYRSPVAVQVLASRSEGNIYFRKILLRRTDTREPVQFGIIRFDLKAVPKHVRNEVLAEQIPLGKVLIQHEVPRQIELKALFELVPGRELAERFQMVWGGLTYGRLARIICYGIPAVQLLEIVTPQSPGRDDVSE